MTIYNKYPNAYAIYDTGKYYGVCIQESFHFVDKNTLEIVKTLPRYDSEVLDVIEKAVPIYYADQVL